MLRNFCCISKFLVSNQFHLSKIIRHLILKTFLPVFCFNESELQSSKLKIKLHLWYPVSNKFLKFIRWKLSKFKSVPNQKLTIFYIETIFPWRGKNMKFLTKNKNQLTYWNRFFLNFFHFSITCINMPFSSLIFAI